MTLAEAERCQAAVYVRDCLRYTGRGKYGYEMHYNERRCKRRAGSNGVCWQHTYSFLTYKPLVPTPSPGAGEDG